VTEGEAAAQLSGGGRIGPPRLSGGGRRRGGAARRWEKKGAARWRKDWGGDGCGGRWRRIDLNIFLVRGENVMLFLVEKIRP
jgi:hypothetical protein